MPKFYHFTDLQDQTISINLNNVIAVFPHGDQTRVLMDGGKEYFVKGSYDDVSGHINGAIGN